MDTQVDRSQTSQITLGTMLVVVGFIFLGQRLGWGPAWNFGQLWPFLLIGLGVVQLIASRGQTSHGYFWIFVGVIFLLDRAGVLALRDSWPLFLVAAGVSLMFDRHDAGRKGRRLGDQ